MLGSAATHLQRLILPMPLQLLALALAAFSVGTTEFIIAGILPAIARDLGVTIPTAGYLISGYAAGVAVGGPIIAIVTAGLERKATLLGLMTLFIAGNVLCALAPAYGWLMAARIVIALTHGALLGFASVAAAEMVAEERRGRAIALVLAGLTTANIIGVPLGTTIGHALGWRAAFWAIAALGLVSLVGMVVWLPRMTRRGAANANLRAELRVLRRPEVYISLLIIALAAMAYFGLFAYIAPLFIDVGGVNEQTLPLLLAILGVASLAGILAGGRLADWRLMPSVVGILVLEAVVNLLLPFLVHGPALATAGLFVWTVVGVPLIATPLQTRILNGARDAPNLASTLISSAFNVGISVGAALGATALTRGIGYDGLPWLALMPLLVGLALALAALSQERRAAAIA